MNELRKIYGSYLAVWRAIFCYPKKTLDVNESFDYDSYWQHKRGTRIGMLSDWQKARADIIARTIEGTDLTIADIGCGDGSILSYIQEHRKGVSKIVGYDTSPFALEKARTFGVETIQADLREKGWEAKLEPADYILLLETIEHVPDSEQLVAFAVQKARKGVFISVPNSGYVTYRLRLLFGSMPAQWLNFPNEHLRFWTARDMRWWLRALGYAHARKFFYKGAPLLNRIWPSLFAAGQVVYIPVQH